MYKCYIQLRAICSSPTIWWARATGFAQKAGGIINHEFINTLKSSSKFLIGERDPKWELGVNMEKLAVFKEEFSENSDI